MYLFAWSKLQGNSRTILGYTHGNICSDVHLKVKGCSHVVQSHVPCVKTVNEFMWIQRKFHCATSQMVPGSIPGGVAGDFFPLFHHNYLLLFRLSLWKWVPGISPGVKAAGVYGWRLTTLVMPNVKKIRGLNWPGTPWACPGLLRDDLYLYKESLCLDWEKAVSCTLLLVTNIAWVLHSKLLVATLLYKCTKHCGISGV
jgi:hypothetical protein